MLESIDFSNFMKRGALFLLALGGLVFLLTIYQAPASDFPEVRVNLYGETAPGRIYTGNSQLYNYLKRQIDTSQPIRPHAMIFDKNGVLKKKFKFDEPYGINFSPRPDGGYYYAQAVKSPLGVETKHSAGEKWVLMDEDFGVEAVYQVIGHPNTDGHELVFLSNQNLLLMSYDQKPDGAISCLLQEITLDNQVVWEWDSVDHINQAESYKTLLLLNSPQDYMHCNSVYEDKNQDLIVSFRNTSQIIKINRQTGSIVWRMGGKKNEFEFINDPLNGFSAQHHAQIIENGNLLLYDNGNQHEPPQTRVLEYAIDEANKTAELVWSYQIDGKFTEFTGSVQRLPNGHTFIGWGWTEGGGTLRVTELNREDEVVLEMHFPPAEVLYRTYKY